MKRLALMIVTGLVLVTGVVAGADPLVEPGGEKQTEEGTPSLERTTPATAPVTDAVQPQEETPDLLERVRLIFERGGTVMWILLGVSVMGLAFGLERLVGLRMRSQCPRTLIDQVEEDLKTGGVAMARSRLAGASSALGRVLDGLLAREGATRSEMERILEDELGRVLWDERMNIRPVGMVASVAPLLGLLGTVIGLINAFQNAAARGLDDPSHFAEGIYQALYTTAFGLCIAIPFVILYQYLRGKADVIIRALEDRAIRFIIETSPSLSVPSEEAAPESSPAAPSGPDSGEGPASAGGLHAPHS